MFRKMLVLGLSAERASGPALDAECVLKDPTLSEECLDHITSVPREQFSRYVSEMMDRLGYSYTMIKERQKMVDDCNKLTSRCIKDVGYQITTGGKGEGTSLFFESDTDFMLVNNKVICTEHPQDFIHSRDITLFQTEMQDTSPGYTRLKLVRLREDENCLIINSLIVSEDSSLYSSGILVTNEMSNDLKNKNDRVKYMTVEATSGPSTPVLGKTGSYDMVVGLLCICDEHLEHWVYRPRYHGWPSSETIRKISRLDGHVVPVGFKGSETMHMEWRICYSLAELHLMRTLNEFQLKLYVMLKKISKSILNPVCSDITSYIMKNIVFWVSETNGVERFTEDLLIDRLLDCIGYLLKCVREKTLPSYMIPERNLFAGRLDDQKSRQLTGLLSDLLNEGRKMLLRCDMFKEAMIIMYISPDMLIEFAEIRDKVESHPLMRRRLLSETKRPEMSKDEMRRQLSQKEEFYDISMHIVYLIKSNFRELRQIGKTEEEISDLFGMKLKELLS